MHHNLLRVSPSIYTLSFFIHEQIQYGTESKKRAILCYKHGFIDKVKPWFMHTIFIQEADAREEIIIIIFFYMQIKY